MKDVRVELLDRPRTRLDAVMEDGTALGPITEVERRLIRPIRTLELALNARVYDPLLREARNQEWQQRMAAHREKRRRKKKR